MFTQQMEALLILVVVAVAVALVRLAIQIPQGMAAMGFQAT
jgi:hypothetical protein